MPIASIADLLRIARESFQRAQQSADEIGITANFSESVKVAKARYAKSLNLLSNDPEYKDIQAFNGIQAHAAILSFDLRKSSDRATRLGPKDTFITMHTYMTTMLDLLRLTDAVVVGLRGDGAIAAFQLQRMTDPDTRVDTDLISKGVGKACSCGDAMIHATNKVVNKVLAEGGIDGSLIMGVGIDQGYIVATNIGLGGARDLTAYGHCVNRACKISDGNNIVKLTKAAKAAYPNEEGGGTSFRRHSEDEYVLQFPPTYQTLR